MKDRKTKLKQLLEDFNANIKQYKSPIYDEAFEEISKNPQAKGEKEMNDKRNTFESKKDTLYLKKLREMNGERRLEITSELFEAVKEVAKAGIEYQNPDISRDKSKKELLKRIYG